MRRRLCCVFLLVIAVAAHASAHAGAHLVPMTAKFGPAARTVSAHFKHLDPEMLADRSARDDWRRKNGTFDGYLREYGPKRASAWKAAAERGSSIGMVLYGQCLQFGAGVETNAAEAAKWYRKAADLGDAEAMFCLGWCCKQGNGGRGRHGSRPRRGIASPRNSATSMP